MSFTRCSHLVALLVVSACTVPAQQAPETPPASHSTLPQIVRLSLVEGDVRVARGKQDEKLTGNTWEQAAAGIPLQSGFNLATGADGRAEIEFEDTSTIYLAPNSALALSDLTTKDGIPNTRLALLSGSATLHVQPNVPGDTYRIETPTETIAFNYGDVNYTRVNSYLDGLQITPMDDTHLVFNHVRIPAPAGTRYDVIGDGIFKAHTQPSPDLLAFDAWVNQRVSARDAHMKLVMEQAGLKTPIPGLADLADKGTFTPCAPYGTCWEPTNGWTHQSSDTTTPIKPLPEANSHTVSVTQLAQTSGQTPSGLRVVPTGLLYDELDDFPCNPRLFLYQRLLYSSYNNVNDLYAYDWAVCHAGFWINRNHRYMWVAGTHKHHLCPVRWVKYQGKLGYVPMHPHDQRGEPPVNLRHGLYALTDKPDHPIERVALDVRSQPKFLDTTPKEFRNPSPPLLARADSPEIAVRSMHEPTRANTTGAQPHSVSSTLTFNSHSDRFMIATRVTEDGHTHTFTEPMSNRGGHIASPSAGGFHSGFASNGGVVHAGSSSAGGSHGGGGGSSGGGGSHGGGGSSSSASSGGGTSSGGSGGGSHH